MPKMRSHAGTKKRIKVKNVLITTLIISLIIFTIVDITRLPVKNVLK